MPPTDAVRSPLLEGDDSRKPQPESVAANRAKKRVVQRYVTFVWGCVLCLCAGTLYGFSCFNTDLKKNMVWDGTEVNNVFGIGAVGQYIGFPPGWLFDRFGVRVTCLYAAFLGFLGYFLMYLQTSTHFSTSSVVMGLFYALVGQGSIGLYMAGLLSNVRNFSPKHRGIIVGLLASGFGLSAALFAAIKKGAFEGDPANFLLMLAITLGASGLGGAALMTVVGPPEEDDAVDLEKSGLLENESLAGHDNEQKTKNVSDDDVVDITGMELARTPQYWVLFALFGLGCGAGLMFISNVGLLAMSHDLQSKKALYTQITSYSNCAGRLIVGFASDATKNKLTRPFWILVSMLSMLLTHSLLAADQGNALFAGLILDGLSYGALFSIVPTFLSERFGVLHFGFNWGVTTLALAAGNLILGKVAGAVYDAHGHTGKDGSPVCNGDICFETTFVVSSLCAATGCVLAAYLVYAHRKRGMWM
eukprot:GFYU01004590.1.p1 GENE.GFYU01004590.1~~GFYU01004590.1.p1  ORF type:complete len:474 (-),score=122.47 GFYU01004590.1:70-1491(-)